MDDPISSASQNISEPTETRARSSRDPLVGTTLDGRYLIEEVLGSGGMSVVYKATQTRVNRHVAVKTLKMQLDTKPVYRERFQREIDSLCTLSHPNIVTVYDCLIGPDDQPYVVMDYLRGKSLEALIKDEGPLDVGRFARICVQVCSALDHAHRKGIVHRDLKPGNIVLMDEEMDFVKVVDFGLAKLGQDSRKLTQSGELWGSPPYMSPEQCKGQAEDVRSDLYSFGVVMYEMLAGKDPFYDATTVFELIQCHVNTPPPLFSTVNPVVRVPEPVAAVIFKAMEKEPANRYQTALELQDALVKACSSNVDRDAAEHLFHLAGQARIRPAQFEPSKIEESAAPAMNAADYFNMALNPMQDSIFTNVQAEMASAQPSFAAQADQSTGAANIERESALLQQMEPIRHDLASSRAASRAEQQLQGQTEASPAAAVDEVNVSALSSPPSAKPAQGNLRQATPERLRNIETSSANGFPWASVAAIVLVVALAGGALLIVPRLYSQPKPQGEVATHDARQAPDTSSDVATGKKSESPATKSGAAQSESRKAETPIAATPPKPRITATAAPPKAKPIVRRPLMRKVPVTTSAPRAKPPAASASNPWSLLKGMHSKAKDD
ncbi:MAG TPA: protein kinase [Candidatus Obscuribacterales bacterium]